MLDLHDRPIPGLYACGNVMSNVFGFSYPGPGATLGSGLTFGYRGPASDPQTALTDRAASLSPPSEAFTKAFADGREDPHIISRKVQHEFVNRWIRDWWHCATADDADRRSAGAAAQHTTIRCRRRHPRSPSPPSPVVRRRAAPSKIRRRAAGAALALALVAGGFGISQAMDDSSTLPSNPAAVSQLLQHRRVERARWRRQVSIFTT